MGLENGIVLEMNTNIKYQPWFCDLELDRIDIENNNYIYDAGFWCGEYDLRRKILDLVHANPNEGSGEYVLNSTEVLKLINLLTREIMYSNKCGSKCMIWDVIDNLYWVYEYMSKRPQDIIRCYFYDSW